MNFDRELEIMTAAGISERNAMLTIDWSRVCSYAELGRDEGLSTSRVRQIVCASIRKLSMYSKRGKSPVDSVTY